MNAILKNTLHLQKWATDLKGVFSISDLENLVQPRNKLQLHRVISKLVHSGLLRPFSRGYYVMESFDAHLLSTRLCENSYVSLTTILAKNLVIGSIPQKTIYAVKLGKSRTYQSPFLEVVHKGITKDLFFGFKKIDGICFATAEKAYLDALYFHQKGSHYSFNIYQDISLERLDQKMIMKYLQHYKNPKFVRFVRGMLHG